MYKNIDVTVYKNEKKLFKKRVELDLSNENKVNELVNTLKSKVNEDIKNFEVVKEEFFFGTVLMKPEESVKAKSGLELVINVK